MIKNNKDTSELDTMMSQIKETKTLFGERAFALLAEKERQTERELNYLAELLIEIYFAQQEEQEAASHPPEQFPLGK